MEDAILSLQLLINKSSAGDPNSRHGDGDRLVPKPEAIPFDINHGPGDTQWIGRDSDERTLIVAFHQPQTIRQVKMDVEECAARRTQEVQLTVSSDTGPDGSRFLRISRCDLSMLLYPLKKPTAAR